MAFTIILLFNIIIHLIVGVETLRKLLGWQRVKTTLQQAILVSAAVILGMNLITRALSIIGIKPSIKIVILIIWTIVGSAGFLNHTYGLKKNKLYLTITIWALVLLVASVLIGILDAIILSL